MIPWIQIYANILTHDKTYALAGALNIPNYAAVGIMVSLWSWTAVNSPDGDITGYPPRAIAEAVGWKKSAAALTAALISTKLIDVDGDRTVIHNWENYAALLMDTIIRQRKNTKKRTQRYRKKSDDSGASCDVYSDVTVTSRDAPTVPYHTVPNTTAPFSRSSTCRRDDSGGETRSGAVPEKGEKAGPFGKLKAVGGDLGRGVVLMSDNQFDDLLEKLTLDEFNTYVAKLAHLIADKGYRYSRPHYQAILEMVEKDRKAGGKHGDKLTE